MASTASTAALRPPRIPRQSAPGGTGNEQEAEFHANHPGGLDPVRSIPINPRLQTHQNAIQEREARAARKLAKKAAKAQQSQSQPSVAAVSTSNSHVSQSQPSTATAPTPNVLGTPSGAVNSMHPFQSPASMRPSQLQVQPRHGHLVMNQGGSMLSHSTNMQPWNQNYPPQPNLSSPLPAPQMWTPSRRPESSFNAQSSPLMPLTNLAMGSNYSGPYSFMDDLTSDLPPGFANDILQPEIEEIAGDPSANLSDESSSSSSDSEEEEVAKVNEEALANENASSGLTVTRRHVQLVPQKRKAMPNKEHSLTAGNEKSKEPEVTVALQNVNDRSNESEPAGIDDAAQPEMKKRKKARASRSIGDLDETLREITELAYDKIKTAVTNIQPWPETEDSANKLETEVDKMAADAWDESCVAQKMSVDPTRPALKLIKDRVYQFRGTLKTVAASHVPAQYGFVYTNKLDDPTPAKVAAATEKNRELVAKLQERFYYKDPFDEVDKTGLYRNVIIQHVLNAHWFGSEKSHRRSHDFDGQDMLSLTTFALILTSVSCGIDMWETGHFSKKHTFDRDRYYPRFKKHLAKLNAWAAFSAKPSSIQKAGSDICADLRRDLLCNARACLPESAPTAAADTDCDEASMLAEFEANFG